jgi:hypothetical protein
VHDGERRERDGPEDLDRDPPDEPALGLDRAGEQRGRGTGVLRAGIPRPASQLGGDERVPVALVERV